MRLKIREDFRTIYLLLHVKEINYHKTAHVTIKKFETCFANFKINRVEFEFNRFKKCLKAAI